MGNNIRFINYINKLKSIFPMLGGSNPKKYERTPKISNSYSYFFVFFANRRKNRHKTRRRQYIFVTNLKLAPYIVAKTSILGVKHHTTYIKVSK